MSTSVAELKEWFETGKEKKATHMVVVCDTFDWEDFPVYVEPQQDVSKVIANLTNPSSMNKVMEVYSYKKSWEEQGTPGSRVWNLD